MNVPTTKIKGYKQVGLEVYRYHEKEKRYHRIATNTYNLPLQKFVDTWIFRQENRIKQIKEKEK
jgi:hypothetical protein